MSSAGTSTGVAPQSVPLCVDLDGTLVRTNLLWECIADLLRRRPFCLLMLPVWLIQGRAILKRRLAERAQIVPDRLPYRQDVLEFLRQQRALGRRLVLATAADQALAEQVARHLDLFAEVHGSAPGANLRGRRKAEFLAQRFGERGFAFLGDSRSELAVWRHAGEAFVVGSPALRRAAARSTLVSRSFDAEPHGLGAWLRSLRLHHWSKNLLIFVPVLLAHRSTVEPWKEAAAAFVLFGLCASGLYLLNDLLDLHSDREHPWKQRRPFASGQLPLWMAAAGTVLLTGGSLALAALLSPGFAAALLLYALLTVAYSWKIKQIPMLDVFVLSGFYALRVWAGGLVTATPLSHWFVAFAAFFFLSLAMAKRTSELLHARELLTNGNSGRGYRLDDRELLTMIGVASCFASVIILALYTQSPEVNALYHAPHRLLLLCPVVLYWLSRLWLRAVRGELQEDPVTFALRDFPSWLLAGSAAAVLLVSNLVVR